MKDRGQDLRSEGKEQLETLPIVTRVIPDTLERDELAPEKRVVVFFDICSSSKFLENLSQRGNLKRYRDLLIVIKKFLLAEQARGHLEAYKFIGDGWVLLLPSSVKGEQFANLLYRLAELFKRELEPLIRQLESTPEVLGLTFGADKGELVRIVMDNRHEYIGRPLNIAARLQAAVKDRDKETNKNPAYKLLISKPAFDDLRIPQKYRAHSTSRKLRNIQGGDNYECFEVIVLDA